MTVTINAKGTSVPYFKIGKGGVTIYQGSSDPSLTYTLVTGDYWLDTTNKLSTWSGSAWIAPTLDNLNFNSSTIAAVTADDITLTPGTGKSVVVTGSSGPGMITTDSGYDLTIDPSYGGGGNLILNANVWPATDGSANQVLTTDGSGYLSFTTIQTVGSPSPAVSATTGFAYIPVMSGPPTGTPATISGYVPIVADASGNKMWVYIGGVWRYVALK